VSAADPPPFLFDGPETARKTIVLAHGAGAAMDSAFMNTIAAGLADRDLRIARFEFPYMQKRRADGGRRPPDRQPILLACWCQVIAALGSASRLIIGGKSMGGRMASLIADERAVAGLVCLGYPFHPPGRLDKPRTEHLRGLATPTLILQGERDALGNREDVAGYDLSKSIGIHWLGDGDHDLKPRKKSGRTHDQNLSEAIAAMGDFVAGL
jgi:predicted alpha/beta-hydrolase family hydrolase